MKNNRRVEWNCTINSNLIFSFQSFIFIRTKRFFFITFWQNKIWTVKKIGQYQTFDYGKLCIIIWLGYLISQEHKTFSPKKKSRVKNNVTWYQNLITINSGLRSKFNKWNIWDLYVKILSLNFIFFKFSANKKKHIVIKLEKVKKLGYG